jgi:osmotically inducible protein OsmC
MQFERVAVLAVWGKRSIPQTELFEMKIAYTANATATNGGRGVGEAQTDDGRLGVKFSTPKAMGGDDGPGTNPEQLFALGYSACFLGAMRAAAKKAGKKLPDDATVTANVSFADREDNVGYGIVPKLTAKVPGWDKADIEATMTAAHDICPYSNLIRFAHEVELVAG